MSSTLPTGEVLKTDGGGSLSFSSTTGDISDTTSIINESFTKLGTAADQEFIDFSTSNEVNIKVNNIERVSVNAGGCEVNGVLSLKECIQRTVVSC